MDEMNTSVNIEAVAEPQIDNSNTNTLDGGSELINSQSNEKPTQDKETNAAFAEMRRAREAAEKRASQVERDFNYFQKYNNIGVKTEAELKAAYGHQGINTWEDVDRYYEMQQEAERLNVDPALYKEVQDSKQTAQQVLEKLSKYERKELLQQQAEELSKDSKWGSFFNSNKDEIKKVANKLNLDLQTAKLLVLEQKYEPPNLEEVKQNAVKEYIEKLKTGNAPIEGSGTTAIVTGSTTPKTWSDAKKQALAYLRGTNKP